jgi:hypothetical protein
MGTITGSAMRSHGSSGHRFDHADSMIDGRTIDTGTLPRVSQSARSPTALV